MSNPQLNCCLKIDFQKVDQHAGGKWLIHDTKRRMDNQLQSLKLPCNATPMYNSWKLIVYTLYVCISNENKRYVFCEYKYKK